MTLGRTTPRSIDFKQEIKDTVSLYEEEAQRAKARFNCRVEGIRQQLLSKKAHLLEVIVITEGELNTTNEVLSEIENLEIK